MKLVYERLRLNSWCDDIRFALVTPGVCVDFDDLQIEFIFKNKSLQFQYKLRDIRLDDTVLNLPLQNPVRLLFN